MRSSTILSMLVGHPCRFLALAAVVVATFSPLAVQAAPKIQHWLTEAGARVYFVPAPELPMVNVSVAFDAGSARDGDAFGLACMTSSVLGEGAGDLDADARADELARLGATISNDCDRDMGTVSLRSLTRPEVLAAAVGLLTKVLREPRFDAGAIERVRKQTRAALRQQQQSPGSVAGLAVYKALYGDLPYAHNSIGDRASVDALTREQMVDFYRRYYQAGNAVIAIVGDLDRSQAEQLAAGLVGCHDGVDCAPPPPLAAVPALTQPFAEHIDFPASQDHIRIAAVGMARGDPDYFTLFVANHILGGGGLVSRLSDEVREKRGLAYSVYSYFSPLRVAGPFVIGLQTAAKNRDEALAVLRETLQRFVTEGPTEAELEATHLNLSGGFGLRIASNSQLVSYLAVIGFYDLPLDYLDRWVERVEAVTAADIRDALKRRVRPGQMATIVVGRGAQE